MYPGKIFLGMDLYSILILVGVILCMVFVRLLSDHRHMKAAWQNLLLFGAILAVVLGYGSAVLLQAVYNYLDDGVFTLANDTGSTFYGGLIGGTAVFIILYFAAGHFLFRDGYHKKHFRDVSDMAAPCITVAHGFGRLGCLMAGCCYGKPTDAWFGVQMAHLDHKVIPVQLFEAIFLLAFAGILFVAFWNGKKYLLPAYMIGYGIWRFPAEMMRADDRGATIVDFLTPSQLISVLLILGGIALLVVELVIDRRACPAAAEGDVTPADPLLPSDEASATEAIPDEEAAEAADTEAEEETHGNL